MRNVIRRRFLPPFVCFSIEFTANAIYVSIRRSAMFIQNIFCVFFSSAAKSFFFIYLNFNTIGRRTEAVMFPAIAAHNSYRLTNIRRICSLLSLKRTFLYFLFSCYLLNHYDYNNFPSFLRYDCNEIK